MKNTIAERIYDFLKNYPPFSFLTSEELYLICQNVKVIYLENGNYVFSQEEQVHDDFYVVKDGAVGVFREGENVLVDKCDEGDIFGLRALIRKGNY
ncbi:MAG: cyclic nucleotide-binding domain-containing protein, partial [Flavobacteriaceae bacterium]|nr:cyclic nucleotide-binding domain-containing protein [Flavobacteriaceae bacterium]